MTLRELIEDLKKKKIDIYLIGNNLKVEDEKGVLVPELVNTIREHKPELVDYLSSCSRRDDKGE